MYIVLYSFFCSQVAPKSDVNTTGDNMYKVMQQWMAHFSRPGSAYVINTGTTAAPNFDNKVECTYVCDTLTHYSNKIYN